LLHHFAFVMVALTARLSCTPKLKKFAGCDDDVEAGDADRATAGQPIKRVRENGWVRQNPPLTSPQLMTSSTVQSSAASAPPVPPRGPRQHQGKVYSSNPSTVGVSSKKTRKLTNVCSRYVQKDFETGKNLFQGLQVKNEPDQNLFFLHLAVLVRSLPSSVFLLVALSLLSHVYT